MCSLRRLAAPRPHCDLSEDQTVHALGIVRNAIRRISNGRSIPRSMVKRMHAGRSSAAVVYTALCSRRRAFHGVNHRCIRRPSTVVFDTTFSRSNDRFKLDELTAGLGSHFETMMISLKFYSCVGKATTRVSMLSVPCRARRPFTVQDVNRVVVHASQVPRWITLGGSIRPEGYYLSAAEFAVLCRNTAP